MKLALGIIRLDKLQPSQPKEDELKSKCHCFLGEVFMLFPSCLFPLINYIACGRKDKNRDTAVDGLRIATLKVMQDEQA